MGTGRRCPGPERVRDRLRVRKSASRTLIEMVRPTCPDWRSRKNGDGALERVGGYGLVLVTALAARFDRSWVASRGSRWVRMRAQFRLAAAGDRAAARRRAASCPGSQCPDFPLS